MDLSMLNRGEIAETTYLTNEMFRRQNSTNRSYGFRREMGYYKASITGLNMMVGLENWLEKRLWDFDIQEMERDFGYTYSYLRHLVKDCTGERVSLLTVRSTSSTTQRSFFRRQI